MVNKVWSVNDIKENIIKSDIWLTKAILAIYSLQTASEQASEVTIHINHVGFSAFDALRMSYYAKWLKSGRTLSGTHKDLARKKILRYVKQLTKIANKEI